MLGPMLNSEAAKSSKKHRFSAVGRPGLRGSILTSNKSDITKNNRNETLAS